MENMNEKYREKNPFTVPDGYFDRLTERIMELTESKKEIHKSNLLQVFRPYIGIVAMFVVMMGGMYMLVPIAMERGEDLLNDTIVQGTSEEEILADDIFDSGFNPTNDEIIEYLAIEIDNYELILADVY